MTIFMVEVFKTNITSTAIADSLIAELQLLFPHTVINFDLDDCDNILRIKGENIQPLHVVAHLETQGHLCEILH
ncbi:MAG: hypothetical protein K0Q79_1554 [Flavipsychrobacter sp.]|jgi:hypothetical protein|nr:hypothetical protein [Flavipsychrobacter sp.]